MLLCSVVLIILTHIISNCTTVDAFPPLIFSNFTYLTPKLSVAPQYFSVQLFRFVVKNKVKESIVYTPNVNGDRLRSVNGTPPTTLQMFASNDAFVLKNHWYNDQLCLDRYNNYKMLTRPSGLHLPNDCMLYVDNEVLYTTLNDTQVEYIKNDLNDELCVRKTTSFDISNSPFRLYTKVKSLRYYVVVSNSKMTSTSVKNKATIFLGVVHNLCLNKVNGDFVCLLNRKNNNCSLKKLYEDSVKKWKQEIIKKQFITTPSNKNNSNTLNTTLNMTTITNTMILKNTIDTTIKTTIINFITDTNTQPPSPYFYQPTINIDNTNKKNNIVFSFQDLLDDLINITYTNDGVKQIKFNFTFVILMVLFNVF
ncbi:hypothetical protein [Psilogramma increta granulovirus]|uniref:Uncharacterized protein n=1 Tax=Psilogramma increta granulovirus TaxID=2953508 RepID=A0A977TP06_9BBAC|nr:hypothetical protein [Psilogramma increta granulovirus]